MTKHLNPSLLISLLALFIALGGTSYAVSQLPKNSVGNKQLKKNAVTAVKVKDGSLLAKDFKAGQLPQGPRGEQGPAGPATVAAGGALSGNYPNPTLAPGSVSAAQLGSIPTAFIRFDGTKLVGNTGPDTPFTSGFIAVFDNANMVSSDDGVLTAPRAGLYQVSAQVTWAGASAADGEREMLVQTNPSSSPIQMIGNIRGGATIGFTQSSSGIMKLEAGQQIILTVRQDSSDATILIANQTNNGGGTFMSMSYLGPAS